MRETLLGGLSARKFFRRHWQRKPLLVRGALPGFGGVLSRSALFALAARPDVESRLVERRGGRWRVSDGPIDRARLARSGRRNWTLLVNGVDRHCPAGDALLRRFAFLPQARLDDLMVSYAEPGGGVGPHFDSYDVILLQGHGRRLWRLERRRAYALVPGAPLRLIAGFRPEEEVLLEPGDLLYLPPGWGHDGIALEPSLTHSIGFRAPRGAELAASFLDYLHERGLADAEYRDPGLRGAAHPGRIGSELLDFAERQLARIRWNRRDVERFLGEFLSAPAQNAVFLRPRRVLARSAFQRALAGRQVALDPATRLLYRGGRFFVNGDSVVPGKGQRAALAALADRRRAPGRELLVARLGELMHEWYRAGYLRLAAVP